MKKRKKGPKSCQRKGLSALPRRDRAAEGLVSKLNHGLYRAGERDPNPFGTR